MKKVNWKLVSIIAVLVVALGVYSLAFAGATVKQNCTLTGEVVTVIGTGANVSEGQVLVQVKTIAGNMPAARATTAGNVTAVLVAPGQRITAGQVVAEIAAK